MVNLSMTSNRQNIIILCIVFLFVSTSVSQSTIGYKIEQESFAIQHDINSIKPKNSAEPNYYAIIIGIEKRLCSTSSNKYIDETATSFYNQLIKGPNWHENNITFLLNENATKDNIKNAITEWLDPLESTNDHVLFYFIGNSYKMDWNQKGNGNTYSLPYDIENSAFAEDKITDKELDSWLDALESDHISLILDTSYASYMNALRQWGRKILASTGLFFPNQENIADYHKKSLFSYHLIKGLNGFADTDYDGCVSTDELFSYAQKKCIDFSIENFKYSIRNFSFQVQIPFMIDRHLGKLNLYTLPFGWKQIADNGFGQNTNYATRGMTIFNNELYIGTQNNIIPNSLNMEGQRISVMATSIFPDFYSIFGDLTRLPMRIAVHLMTFASHGCELWKYNYSTDTLTNVIGDNSISGIAAGFDYHFNAAAAVLTVYKEYIYVGTWNTPIGCIMNPDRKGCEIWRSADGIHWEQVVGHNAPFNKGGFGNPDNSGAWSIKEFKDYLYVGTMNWDFSDQGGCEIWRSQDGLHWEQVVDHGFKPLMSNNEKKAVNTYAWIMEVFQDELYMGTFNSRLPLRNDDGTGCQLWKTSDGANWNKVPLPNGENGYQDGFGEKENYGIRRMTVFNDELYVGIASSFFHDHASEIWKFDGITWTPIISDNVPGTSPDDFCYDGFGNNLNKYIWSMTVTTDNKLWVGTANGQVYLPIISKRDENRKFIDTETDGFELWCFDGEDWEPMIKDEYGFKPNGLGDISNLGARSMIEYPKDSGNIVIGTFKFLNPIPEQPREGCELWMRYTLFDST